MRLPINRSLALAAPFFLAGCALGGSGLKAAPAVAGEGPAADYPVVVGEPFTIEGTTYTPEDVMNYDAVGYAAVGDVPGAGILGAHKTLPLPSYVEVTQLDSGRTVLVRIETRGPMQNDALVGLTPAAALQLGIANEPRSAVRVRRVNPPEAERAMLRAGEPVPARMDTPAALLTVLKRKLGGTATVLAKPALPALAAIDPDNDVVPITPVEKPAPIKTEPAKPAPAKPAVVTTQPTAATKGQFVQIGAFSSEANARKAAGAVSAQVTKAGKFWVVRLGPLASKAETDAALAKARAAGYGDAVVRRIN